MFLIYFILGIIFYIFIIPTLQNLTSVLATFFTKIIYKIQQGINTEENKPPQKYPIGFHTDCIGIEIPDEEECNQEDCK